VITMSLVWFVTGSSSGIGFETVTQLSADPENLVIATCRNPDSATDLKELKASGTHGTNIHIVKLDVGNEQSIHESEVEVGKILGDRGIDFILNNAALSYMDNAFEIKRNLLMDQFATNVAGPAILAEVYLPYLEKGSRKVVVNYTSGLSTIGVDLGDKASSYSISKAALNMLTYKQAKTRPDLIFIAFNPGTVATNMAQTARQYMVSKLPPGAPKPPPLTAANRPPGLLLVEESVTPSLAFIKTVSAEHSGSLFNRNGEKLSW